VALAGSIDSWFRPLVYTAVETGMRWIELVGPRVPIRFRSTRQTGGIGPHPSISGANARRCGAVRSY
jgi:hypothetical protein